jgi:hypothetical protein
MKAYRLEHKISGLGPFAHKNEKGKQFFEVMSLGYHEDPENMGNSKRIAYLEKRKHWVYGWTSKAKFNTFCSKSLLNKFEYLGFILKIHTNIEDFLVFPDGQILFKKP